MLYTPEWAFANAIRGRVNNPAILGGYEATLDAGVSRRVPMRRAARAHLWFASTVGVLFLNRRFTAGWVNRAVREEWQGWDGWEQM